MLLWLKAIVSVGGIAGLFKALLIPAAFLYGKWVEFKRQNELNERMTEKYDEIEAKELSDKDVDDRLDAGTL